MFKGAGLRTPRKRAEEIGTTSKGYEGQVGYNPVLGVPEILGMPTGEYSEAAKSAHPKEGGSPQHLNPFTVK
jgi:hypothetical protein